MPDVPQPGPGIPAEAKRATCSCATAATDELRTVVAVALHDSVCRDRDCSGSALGEFYRQADVALAAAAPALYAQAYAAERERWTRDAIISRLIAAFPKQYRTPDPADESCMIVFTADDGYPAMRSLTYGEIGDALADLLKPEGDPQ